MVPENVRHDKCTTHPQRLHQNHVLNPSHSLTYSVCIQMKNRSFVFGLNMFRLWDS